MLQTNLLAVKGKLLEYTFIMYKDMNSDEKGVDYQEFYLEFGYLFCIRFLFCLQIILRH